MNILKVGEIGDSVVLHFESTGNSINAYTFASAIVSIADAAKAANAVLNHGHEIEIVVDAIGPGSFRTKIRAIYSSKNNLFSENPIVGNFILGIICTCIGAAVFSQDTHINIDINTDEVVITSGNDRIIVPRVVYDAQKKLESDSTFVGSISKTISSIASDDAISSIGFVKEMDSPKPKLQFQKAVLQEIELTIPDDPDTRVKEEECKLGIIKAILKKSKRKWEFAWRDFVISASIIDDSFYKDFTAREISIAPGDTLKVTLKIKQVLNDAGIYSNKSYTVVKVHEHIPKSKQQKL